MYYANYNDLTRRLFCPGGQPHDFTGNAQEDAARMREKKIETYMSPHVDAGTRQATKEALKKEIREEIEKNEREHRSEQARPREDAYTGLGGFACYWSSIPSYEQLYARYPGELVDEVLSEGRG